ncbi:MAG: SDR family oxidoreductase [Spirochaetaceae bacterium]|nr:SDR family oxidoreductase [Myxococcales bacterium]MCB9723866.1 SDR family oxidoreductase [Spirochaetaceae bacterium]HPG27985.1 SDR family oxidoreductase [Myxococcota bacterium]
MGKTDSAGAFPENEWALILGGSSGFGLATAKRLARGGLNVLIVHRDRRGAMKDIQPHFDELAKMGVGFHTWNVDAIAADKRLETIDEIARAIGPKGRIRVLMHSIAFGNLKLIAPEKADPRTAGPHLAERLGVDPAKLTEIADELFDAGEDGLHPLTSAPEYPESSYLDEEDFARTILSMGTSLLGWTQELFKRGLFAPDTRIFGMTSEGNEVAWKGYAAVSAAKVSLEALSRSIAAEFGPHGIRSNVIQAGVTDTPALRAIPGSTQLKSQARLRNPGRRLTTPEDVAGVIYLLSLDEARWINGEVIRVDGGEHISGVTR